MDRPILVPRASGVATLLLVWLVGVSGCKSGGGGDNQPTAPTTGTASGVLVIPPNHTLETEPNNEVAQAQTISPTQNVAGRAAEGDAGFVIPGPDGFEAEDLYRLTTSGNVRITLTIAAADLDANDLDLLLMDSAGSVRDVSQGLVGTEALETGGTDTFLVGIRAFQGSSAYVLSTVSTEGLASTSLESIPPGAELVPGEILVKWKADSTTPRRNSTKGLATHAVTHQESFPQGVELVKVSPPPRPIEKAGGPSKFNLPGSADNELKVLTLDAVQKLRADPGVEYAEPNFIRRPAAVPNDAFYGLQWHSQLMNLPQAWDVTTGSNSVIVGVIDTGVVLNHPDLNARLITGYDFISNATAARDGNGIDSDPTDIGDDPQGASSSFHGTHVAGTLGAATNNATGVAGVTWQTQIMPLRVLGVGGGTDADIAQAIRYAARLANSSETIPAQRADVINLSLGAPGFSQTLHGAIQAARAEGVIIVAAAGNESTSTPFYPASYDGVISVSAVDIGSQKTSYSNYGAFIDVAAPGGDISADLNGDGSPDGVLSTIGNDAGTFGYAFLPGTSMASPHVAGVMALMLAVNPQLTPADIDQLLAGTHPNTTRRITRDVGIAGRDDLYGHGLLDAAQAVIAAAEIPGGAATPPGGSILAVSTQALDFSNFLPVIPFEVNNAGVGTLSITTISDNASWLSVAPASGTAPRTVIASVDRSGLAVGTYAATITVTSDASQGSQTATLDVEMAVGGTTAGDVGTVFVLTLDQTTLDTVNQVEATAANGYAFSTSAITPGTYWIFAGTDRDNDDLICDIEDACGFYPVPVTIAAGENVPNVSFVVGELSSPQGAAGALSGLHGRTFRRLR